MALTASSRGRWRPSRAATRSPCVGGGPSASDGRQPATSIARSSTDAEGPPPTHDDLVTALEERHLSRLDAVGVVDYDPRSGTVRYRGQPTLEKWLEHVTAVDDGRI